MNASVKSSLYRVVSDLLKADKVISLDELEFMDKVCEDYGISEEDRLQGYQLTMADAMECLAGLPAKKKSGLVKRMIEGTTTDGICSRDESILIQATKEAFDGAKVVSAPAAGISLPAGQFLYVEERGYAPANALLSKDDVFVSIGNMARLGGFEVIYIPRVAQHYASYGDKAGLARVISLVSPAHTSRQVDETIMALQHMTTSYYYRYVLKEKMRLPIELEGAVWMLRIADNVVDGVDYANFLCLPVRKDVVGQLRDFVAGVSSRIGEFGIIANSRHDGAKDFLYSGFYKAILDVMAVKKIDRWELRIRMYGDGMEMFRDPDTGKKTAVTIWKDGQEYPVFVSGRDAAFYLLLLCASAGERGCVDFNDMSMFHKIQSAYEMLYQRVSRRSVDGETEFQRCPDVTSPQTRIPMKSRLASALRASRLTEQSLYLPQEKGRGILYVPLEAGRVRIMHNHGSEMLLGSDLFASAIF